MGRTRGDFAGGILYVSNWYQIVVGQGYTANEAFVPLRHLWSLAVEEQFYLIWPLVMVAVLASLVRRDLPRLALWFAGTERGRDGRDGVAVPQRRRRGHVHGRSTAGVLDVVRSVHQHQRVAVPRHAEPRRRPAARCRVRDWSGDRRRCRARRCANKAHTLDAIGVLGLVVLGWLTWTLWLSEGGRQFGIRFDSAAVPRWLPARPAIATLAVIAAVTHQRSLAGHGCSATLSSTGWARAATACTCTTGRSTRSSAARPASRLRLSQFVVAMMLTTPDHRGELSLHRVADPPRANRRRSCTTDDGGPPMCTSAGDVSSASFWQSPRSSGFAGVSIALAPNKCVGQVECDLAAATDDDRLHCAAPDSSPVDTVPSTAGRRHGYRTDRRSTTSSSSTTSTTLPVEQRPPLAIGESVMLGAKTQLEAAGFVVDAAESRQGKDVVDVARPTACGRPAGQHRRDPHRHQWRGLRRDVRGDHGQPSAGGSEVGVVPDGPRRPRLDRRQQRSDHRSPVQVSRTCGSVTGPTSYRTSPAWRTTASTSVTDEAKQTYARSHQGLGRMPRPPG